MHLEHPGAAGHGTGAAPAPARSSGRDRSGHGRRGERGRDGGTTWCRGTEPHPSTSRRHGGASAVPGAGTNSRGPCAEPQGRRHPKSGAVDHRGLVLQLHAPGLARLPPRTARFSKPFPLPPLSCSQPMETLVQLNLNETLEMPEPRSEATAQGSARGVGKQGLSRVSLELGAPALCLFNMIGHHTRALFVPSLPKF